MIRIIIFAAAITCAGLLPSTGAELKPKSLPQILPGGEHDEKRTKRADRYHWYELSEAQEAKLKAAVSQVPKAQRRPVLILCDATTDCRELAQDIDTVLDEAGWRSDIDRPADVVNGLRCTVEWFCKLLTEATGIRPVLDPDEQPQIVLNFGRKGKK